MSTRSAALLALTVVLPAPGSPGQGLLENINLQPPATNPDSAPRMTGFGLRRLVTAAHFSADTLAHGRELWSLDQSLTATLVKDLNPAGDSDPDGFARAGSVTFFAATHATSGRELWTTQDTAATTALRADLNPGRTSSNPREIVPLGSLVVLSADGGPGVGRELYSCGVAGAPTLIEIRPGPLGSDPQGLLVFDSRIWFSADDGVSGRELWVSDGTAAGTRLVADINPGSAGSDPTGFTGLSTAPRTVYFAASEPSHGRELWRSTGALAGTTLFADLRPGAASSSPQELTAIRVASGGFSGVALILMFAADDGTTGVEPWRLDATTATPTLRRAADVNPGSASSSPRAFTQTSPLTADVVFVAENLTTGREPWKITTSGTVSQLADLMPGPASSNPRFLLSGETSLSAALVLFAATLPGQGEELCVTGGNTANTQTFDLAPGITSSAPEPLGVLSGTPLFAATNGSAVPGVGRELWFWNGSIPTLVQDLRPPEPQSGDPLGGVVFQGRAFFPADDGVRGQELWVSDGTAAGTFLFKDIAPGVPSSQPRDLVVAGSRLYFTANDGTAGRELWTSDGTTSGTMLVLDIQPGAGSSNPDDLVASTGRLYFTATEPGSGRELWLTTGTAASTVLLEVQVGAASSGAANVFAVRGGVLFSANGGSALGVELYASTGTPGTPVLIKDINPGAGSASPSGFAAVPGFVFFAATDATNGRELWRTGLTTASTVLVKDVRSGSAGSSPAVLTSRGAVLLLSADDGVSGRELWKSDGSAAGTSLVLDIAPGASSSAPLGLTPMADLWLFTADDGGSGRELWRTTGAAASTSRVADLFPGVAGGIDPQLGSLTRLGLGNLVLFAGNDGGGGGFEPWRSDGTLAGTRRVADLFAGAGDSLPAPVVTFGHALLFAATTATAGRELHALGFATAGAGNGLNYGIGCANGAVPVFGFRGAPAPGAAPDLQVSGATPNAAAFLLLGAGSANLGLGGTCTLLVAPPCPAVLPANSNLLGAASVSVPIPDDPALLGVRTFWQWAVVTAGGPVFGLLSLSDGLDLLIGR